jgi:hypothetical protein
MVHTAEQFCSYMGFKFPKNTRTHDARNRFNYPHGCVCVCVRARKYIYIHTHTYTYILYLNGGMNKVHCTPMASENQVRWVEKSLRLFINIPSCSLQSDPGGNVNILGGHSKNKCICTCVLLRTVAETELFHWTRIWIWRPIL